MIIKVITGIIGYVVLVLLAICFCIVVITKTLNFLSKSFVGVPLSETCHRLVEKDKPKEIETTENKKTEPQYALKDTIEMNPLSYSVENSLGVYYFETARNKKFGVVAEDLFEATSKIRNETSQLITKVEFSHHIQGNLSFERKTIFTYQGTTLEEILYKETEHFAFGTIVENIERTRPR